MWLKSFNRKALKYLWKCFFCPLPLFCPELKYVLGIFPLVYCQNDDVKIPKAFWWICCIWKWCLPGNLIHEDEWACKNVICYRKYGWFHRGQWPPCKQKGDHCCDWCRYVHTRIIKFEHSSCNCLNIFIYPNVFLKLGMVSTEKLYMFHMCLLSTWMDNYRQDLQTNGIYILSRLRKTLVMEMASG